MTLLGTGWIVGVLMSVPSRDVQVVLQYIFILINSTQVCATYNTWSRDMTSLSCIIHGILSRDIKETQNYSTNPKNNSLYIVHVIYDNTYHS